MGPGSRAGTAGRVTAIPAITAHQMREVDRLMVEAYGIQLIQMMEHAGRNLAELVRDLLGGSVTERAIFVAAGKGNNGGGGLNAARHLSNWGAHITVGVDNSNAFRGVPALQWQTLMKLAVARFEGTAALRNLEHKRVDLVVDALIGYGLDGPPRGWVAEMIEQINARASSIVALDVPSGLDATAGTAHAPCIAAKATMTIALPKTGLLVPDAQKYVGALYLADIGVPDALYRQMRLAVGPIFARGTLIRLSGGGEG